jgi:hypothetical protein
MEYFALIHEKARPGARTDRTGLSSLRMGRLREPQQSCNEGVGFGGTLRPDYSLIPSSTMRMYLIPPGGLQQMLESNCCRRKQLPIRPANPSR